jgi:hypothetical protein
MFDASGMKPYGRQVARGYVFYVTGQCCETFRSINGKAS